jgi:aryl-alcohol dehydrogenase-like predicted oxidoreductase
MGALTWQRTILGRTGLETGRLGLAAGYGVPAASVEAAFERGVNYLYFGSIRRGGFAQALRNLAPRRDRFTLVVQSYTRVAALMGWSLERALRAAQTSYADVLLLGLWNRLPSPRILDAALKLKERGLVRYLAVSSHNRPFIPELARNPSVDVLHVRYNAVHPGAETDVFPHLPSDGHRPGVVTFTATSWGQLLKPGKIPAGEKPPTAADCYRFAMSHPAVDVCISGPSNAQHMQDALEALDLGPMSADELEWMHRVGKAINGK